MLNDRDRSHTRRHRLATSMAACSLIGMLGAGIPAPGVAQDGTNAATPSPPTACSIPATTIDLAEPPPDGATPRDDDASPVAADTTPVAEDPLTAELLAAANTIAGCLNEQDSDTFARITSDEYRGQVFGLDGPLGAAVYSELASTLPDIDHRILELGEVEIVDDTTVTATVTAVAAHQQRTGTWTFTQREIDDDLAWVLEREDALEPVAPANAEEITIEIADARYTLSSNTIEGPDVVFSLSNDDEVDHEALVLRFDEDTTTDDLLRSPGPTLPESVTFIGQATVPAGAEGTMVLVDLPPGTYAIVCLLPDEEGLPYLASGMAAEFIVE